MGIDTSKFPFGQKVLLPGHFDQAVTLEGVRTLGKGFECRVRLASGTLDETVISEEEAHALIGDNGGVTSTITPADGEQVRLLIESARIRLAYRDPVHGVRRIEVKGRKKGQPIRLTTNEWYKAQQLGDSFWLYVVWNPLANPDPVPVMIRNPAKHLEHAAKPVVSARFWDIPAAAIEEGARRA